ncbi:MAG: GDSL family lipase [Phycisphaerae bacterium]
MVHRTLEKVIRAGLLAAAAVIAVAQTPAVAQSGAPASNPAKHTAVQPVPRADGWWQQRHARIVEQARREPCELVFLGDSITQGWEDAGKQVWAERYGSRHALNAGISGDRTQHVLWRLENGLLEALADAGDARAAPKLVVVMIGTNNSNGEDHTAREIADGVTAIVGLLRERLPQTRVLLLSIFPRNEKPDAQRIKNAEASRLAAACADGKTVRALDIGEKFLAPDGTLPRDIMPDLLHLSPRGYEIWAEALEPALHEMLGE